MHTFFSAFYLFECCAVATAVARVTGRSGPEPRLCKFLVWCVIFFSAFFGGFYILGYVNLATDLPVVNPEYSTYVGLVAVLGVWGWHVWKRPESLTLAVSVDDKGWFLTGISASDSRAAYRLAIVTFLTFALTGGMLVFGYPGGYEARAYHLPIALHIFQSQSLQIWDASFMHTLPASASLYFGYLLGFVSEHLVSAGNLVFLPVLFVAVYALGRRTGADESSSLLAALGLLSVPIVAFSAFEGSADVGGIAFLAIAVYFAILRSGPLLTYRALSGLAAGLAFGFKSLHLMSIAYLCAIILLQDGKRRRDQTGRTAFWSAVQPAAIFSLSAFAMASFWLVRNYVELGNPVYPVYLSVFSQFHWTKPPDKNWGDMQFAQFQWVRSSAEWFLYPWLEWHNAGENFKAGSGLGTFFATMVPVACVVSLVRAIRKQGNEWRTIAFLLGGGIFTLSLWAFLDAREPRYSMGALVFLVPLVAATVSLTEKGWRRAFEVILTISVSTMLFVIFSKQLVVFGSSFIYAHHNQRHAFYGYPELVDRLPAGSTVVNFARRTLNYGLFGAAHANRVISYTESFRRIGIQTPNADPEGAPQRADLRYTVLKKLGADYLVTEGSPRFLLDDCVSLDELQRLEKEPGVGTRFPRPYVLYKIRSCAEPGYRR